jgi:tRNA (cytosine49-C5)-methyltransferase
VNKLRQFEQRVASVWDVPARDVAGMLTGARPSTVRVNRLHPGAPDGFGDPVPWCADAYWCTDPAAAIPLSHEGKVYLQNASSLIPVVALDPRPGQSILDTAAAPGGKAFHIAARTGNEGELWLNDAVTPRAEKLRALAGLYHVRYARLTTIAAQYLDKELPHGAFDRILLDVQCSGEGRVDLRRPDGLRYWSPERIEKYKYVQTRMLDAAYRLLRPGGTMVYSTCTIAPEENEAPVSHLLEHRPEARLEPTGVAVPDARPALRQWGERRFHRDIENAVRVQPTEFMEPFFVARIRKVDAG